MQSIFYIFFAIVCYLFRSRGDQEVAILVVLDVVVVGHHTHDLVKLNLQFVHFIFTTKARTFIWEPFNKMY